MPSRAANLPDLTLALPYRGRFGARRPAGVRDLTLPPAPMPPRLGSRPLKRWRYVGLYGPELMMCLGVVRIGPLRQSFWAIWDRRRRRLLQDTGLGRRGVRLCAGRVHVLAPRLELDVELDEGDGIECVCVSGANYAWTRKQGGVAGHGLARVDGERLDVALRGVIDDTAAYYDRHTTWRWAAGVGAAQDGRALAWNLVSGVNDPPTNSERTVWLAGEPSEPGPCTFAADLAGVDGLRFSAEATRERRENLLFIRSRYRQPFGTFSGELPGGIALAEGFGVMEEHDAWW